MAAQSLVLCRDPQTLGVLQPIFSEFDMGVQLCLGVRAASHELQRRHFDTVIVECEEDGTGLRFLDRLRQSPESRTVAVGIVNDQQMLREAFAHGANFVLSKPISVEDAKRILRMSQGYVSRSVRRFLRIAVQRLAHVDLSGLAEPAFLLDLSEGGMAVQALEAIPAGQSFELSFLLPGTSVELRGSGRVVWADASGRAGLEFTDWDPEAQAKLHEWVVSRSGSGADLEAAQQAAEVAALAVDAQSRALRGGWRVLARACDLALLLTAALFFVLIVRRHLDPVPSPRYLLALEAALAGLFGGSYFFLFYLLDAPLPGTWLVQRLRPST